MDRAYTALKTELPYDVVSNQINGTIQSYKNGTDETLLNGQTDLDNKWSYVQSFYDKMKEDLQEVSGTIDDYQIKEIGVQYGGHKITKQGDILDDRSSEGLIDSIDGLSWVVIVDFLNDFLKACKFTCNYYKKFNSEMRNKLKDMKKEVSDIKYIDGITLISDILINIDKESRNVITRFSEDFIDFDKLSLATLKAFNIDKEYYKRYETQFLFYKDIIKSNLANLNGLLKDFNALVKNPKSDATFIDKLTDKANVTRKIIKLNLRRNYDLDDLLPVSEAYYKVNIITNNFFTENKIDANRGIRFRDYRFDNDLLETKTEKYYLVTLKTPFEVKEMVSKIETDELFGSGKVVIENKDKIKTVSAIDIVGKLTVSDLYSRIKSFKNLTPSFSQNCIKYTESMSNICDNIYNSMNETIDAIIEIIRKLTKIENDKVFRFSKTVVSCIMNTIMDSTSTLIAMQSCLMYDNLKKIQLYYSFSDLIERLDILIKNS